MSKFIKLTNFIKNNYKKKLYFESCKDNNIQF